MTAGAIGGAIWIAGAAAGLWLILRHGRDQDWAVVSGAATAAILWPFCLIGFVAALGFFAVKALRRERIELGRES